MPLRLRGFWSNPMSSVLRCKALLLCLLVRDGVTGETICNNSVTGTTACDGTFTLHSAAPGSISAFPPNEHTSEGGRDDRGVPYHAESTHAERYSEIVLPISAKVLKCSPSPLGVLALERDECLLHLFVALAVRTAASARFGVERYDPALEEFRWRYGRRSRRPMGTARGSLRASPCCEHDRKKRSTAIAFSLASPQAPPTASNSSARALSATGPAPASAEG